jgi:hypothetical protein
LKSILYHQIYQTFVNDFIACINLYIASRHYVGANETSLSIKKINQIALSKWAATVEFYFIKRSLD